MRKLVSFSYYVERLSNKTTYPKFLRGQKMKNGLTKNPKQCLSPLLDINFNNRYLCVLEVLI